MGKTIRIECKGAGVIKYEELTIIQGELKSLSTKNYEKLKSQIVDDGFDSPFDIWRGTGSHKGKNCVLDGTQRYRVLGKMKEEGYDLPLFPYTETFAKNYKDAKKRLLGKASQYGRLEKQGLYEFLADTDITLKELDGFNFPEVKMETFKVEYYEELKESQVPFIHDIDKQYIVAVECKDEDEMNKLYEDLKAKGMDCKLIT